VRVESVQGWNTNWV